MVSDSSFIGTSGFHEDWIKKVYRRAKKKWRWLLQILWGKRWNEFELGFFSSKFKML